MEISFAPMIKNSGFSMDGYHIWCGSVIKEGGVYYMFASRWKKENSFPGGYMTSSQIVLAKTDDLSRPFVFERVIIDKRDGGYWDSVMAHNPFIVKAAHGYYLYYIGSSDGTAKNRKIGYAFSGSLDGEWQRCENPLELPENANNPAVLSKPNGEVLLFFRDGDLHVSVARAAGYEGPFEVIQCDIFPSARIEDMYVFPMGGEYVMVCEDADGFFTGLAKGGVLFHSHDAVNWQEDTAEVAYGFDILYEDGSRSYLQRRERPMLFFDGEKSYLFTAAKENGESILCGGDTRNTVQEVFLCEKKM